MMTRSHTKKLSTKFFACIVIGILLPMGLLCLSLSMVYTHLLKSEIRSSTEKSLLYCWQNIESTFSGMLTVSAIINNDSVFMNSLSDSSIDYYDKYVMFNRLLQTIYLQNFGLNDSTWIYLQDKFGNTYCNKPDYSIAVNNPLATNISVLFAGIFMLQMRNVSKTTFPCLVYFTKTICLLRQLQH